MSDPNLSLAIRKTLLYHSIFKYPLTVLEIRRYLIGHRELNYSALEKALESDQQIFLKDGRYYLYDQDYAYETSQTTRAWNLITQAWQTLRRTLLTPYTRLVAVSGSCAALSADPNDDIDLFIIVAEDSYWSSRLITLTKLNLSGSRVNINLPPERNAGRFCVNFMLGDEHLTLSHQDLYTAMEFAHMKILYNQSYTFQKFVRCNDWIKELLPNFWALTSAEWGKMGEQVDTPENSSRLTRLINTGAKILQTHAYQRRHHVALDKTPLWTNNYREKILKKIESLF